MDARTLIRRSGVLRGRPVADVRALIEELYQTTFPMDFASVLANPVEYHPLATDAATGESTDLRPFVGNPLRSCGWPCAPRSLAATPASLSADRQLADYESAPGGQPAALSIRPPASSPEVSRLATDGYRSPPSKPAGPPPAPRSTAPPTRAPKITANTPVPAKG